MRTRARWICRSLGLALALLGFASVIEGAANETEPHLGFVYPAGGRQGTTVRVTLGGQRLRGAERVHFSGRGVKATVVGYPENGRPLKPEQLRDLGKWLKETAQTRFGPGRTEAKPEAGPEKPGSLPDHPFLRNVDDLTARELKKLRDYFFDPTRGMQASPQIADRVELDVTIDADAPPGDRELRIATRAGLTDPTIFQVGTLAEVNETEVNDFRPMTLPDVRAPYVLNGQIHAHDVDRFRFDARGGQKLVVDVQARRLVPYLADAVPGWFQAAITLRNAKGEELAFVDDYRFEPDPVLLYQVPQDGTYELEVRDALYRGRDDFVYRITLGEVPFVTGLFPLGGRAGVRTTAHVTGWNLPTDKISLDTRPGGAPVRALEGRSLGGLRRPLYFAVDELPEVLEIEPNGAAPVAQKIGLPSLVNGRIDPPGDVDVYRFEGHRGDEVVAEVVARRLGSSLDSWLTLTDLSGRVLAENDDTEDRSAGLVTHQADSYVRFRLPADGPYLVRIADAQGHGGDDHAYRLRVGASRPDFSLLVTPSSLNVPAGSFDTLTVHAQRKDGFAGDIEVVLKDAPPGFGLQGNVIPAGRDSVRMTLAAPAEKLDRPVTLVLEGRSRIAGRTVTHAAVPAEDSMQAFGYRHLVPAQELLVSVTRSRQSVPWVEIEGKNLVRLHEGSSALVHFKAPRLPPLDGVSFELSDAPPGVTLGDVTAVRGGFTLTLKAEANVAKVGTRDNLIVDVYAEVDAAPGAKGAPPAPAEKGKPPEKPARRTKRVYVGSLPAIPVIIEPM